ncbi:type II toxin-antitoxin system RelE/ParE family toxin [Ensifer sp. SSB1]|jgi:plasmid stabilization system protein ParE|uniref:type II toxin-antitoxin system RelE/ParE family toxin n=1 Tax=Ensifer sp. SSB1 TaxID=2795385 RepID=UPI001A4E61E9|nr:type II toxin-antitoxin system RelE/ParE family toxin [Ensifer sp. SSB1]MBK5571381.1 type II toxin-antitoxin system RelE/ParE family toxin [Ensifer sp. SSB1]
MSGKRTRWTLRALWRGAYIEKDNPDAAARVVARIVTAVDALAEYPASGPGRIKSTRELVLADIPYIIPYRISPALGSKSHRQRSI